MRGEERRGEERRGEERRGEERRAYRLLPKIHWILQACHKVRCLILWSYFRKFGRLEFQPKVKGRD